MAAEPLLSIHRDGEMIKEVPIQGEAMLGRAEGCVIRLEDRAISRQHALFKRTESGVQIEKKSAFAPLLVNGSEVTSAIIKEGDVINLGPYLLRLVFPKPEPVVTPLPAAPVLEVPVASPVTTEPVADISLNNGGDILLGAMNSPVPEPELVSDSGATAMIGDSGKTRVLGGSSNLRAILRFREGAANHTEYEITQNEVILGRDKTCQIILTDKKASRNHTAIRRTGAAFTIHDLGSGNGTYVNGVRIKEQELSGDDTIRIGDTEFKFSAVSLDYEQNAAGYESPPDEEPVAEAPAIQAPAPMLDPGPLHGVPDIAALGITPAFGAGAPIAGIDQVGTGGKKSLLEKFRALPKRQQVLVAVVVAVGLWFLLEEEPQPVKKKGKDTGAATAPTGSLDGQRTFEMLSPEQRKFVQTQHALSFEFYKNKEYDKTLFEVRKIFQLINDYKDSREIERYALEGKRKLEAIEEEKRKKEEEAKLKARIQLLLSDTGTLMETKKYEEAQALFGEILAVEPENSLVARWQQEIIAYRDRLKLEQEKKQIRSEVNKSAWEVYAQAEALEKTGDCLGAMAIWARVPELEPSDKRVLTKSASMIAACEAKIKAEFDPILAEAQNQESSGDLAQAFKSFEKASKIDPRNPVGEVGMERIRGVLNTRAKVLYTEAVISESYSDFDGAKKKYQEVLDTAPTDDIYYERSKRKLNRYPAFSDGGGGQ